MGVCVHAFARVRAHVCACVRACVRVCVHACVMCLQLQKVVGSDEKL